MPTKNQKGIIHLGILGLVILTAGLFAVTKLASNKDLTFFNIAEKAAGAKCEEYNKETCDSFCSPAGYKCQWKNNKCKSSSKKCNPEKTPQPSPLNSCPGGSCKTGIEKCADINRWSGSGNCNN